MPTGLDAIGLEAEGRYEKDASFVVLFAVAEIVTTE
jgi:hypothetical protein